MHYEICKVLGEHLKASKRLILTSRIIIAPARNFMTMNKLFNFKPKVIY